MADAPAPAAPTQAPAKPQAAAPRPQREQQPASELDKAIGEMRCCTKMSDLDEVMIWSEARFDSSDLERMNQVYGEMRTKLAPQRKDLFQ